MYEKIARGYATAYVNSLPSHDKILTWFDGPKGAEALNVFEKFCFSKKPGRTTLRLAKNLRPLFETPRILCWEKAKKIITADGYSSATENHIFRLPNDIQPLYTERAVFKTTLFFEYVPFDGVGTSTINWAAISHHAISRLVERGAISSEEISFAVPILLDYSTSFAIRVFEANIDLSKMQSFLLPWADGVLVLVFMDMDPGSDRSVKERQQTLSIRTWLPDAMLKDSDKERIEGLRDEIMSPKESVDFFDLWIKGNARPWCFSDSTLEGKMLE
ncbi:MAG: hypothetical protein OXC62_06860 [Aestuariivita sp.]|nr:hypothetical protein [Aestuariivita sp.]